MNEEAMRQGEGRPLPADVAAVWGAFLFEGLMASADANPPVQQFLSSRERGRVETIAELAAHLPEIWRAVQPYWDDPAFDFPGVFEYEVISEWGSRIGDYLLQHDSELPPTEWVQEEIKVLIRAFVRDYEIPAAQPNPTPATASCLEKEPEDDVQRSGPEWSTRCER